jgi:signal transduction histidine kinase
VSARRRLRHNLALHLLGFYLLFIVPILAVALFFDNQASRRLEADVSAADLSLAEAIALETNALLLKAQQAVEAFAQMPAVIDMDLAGMETAFGMGAKARQDINLFYRLDANGTMVFHYPVGPGSTVGTDFSFRDYFQAALVNHGPVFSEGRISPTTERPVATVVMPIRDAQGRFGGVVATNLELQRLTQTLVVIGQDEERGVQVTIVDAAGQIIAHSQPENRLLLNVASTLPGVSQVLAGKHGSLTARDEAGREWLHSYAPIPIAGWGVVVQRPTEIAYASSRAFHRGLILAIGLIACGSVVFWWGLSRRVIRPLEQLTRFGQVGGQQSGDAARARHSLQVLSARRDQLGDLARTLVRMEQDLLSRLAELETLLETSTAVVSSLDTEQVIDNILEQVQRLLDVDTCAVLVQDEATQQLEVRASRGLSKYYVRELRLDASTRQMPAWQAIDSGQPVQVPDVEADPTMSDLMPLVRTEGYRSLLDVPLITPHGPPAVLVVYRTDVHRFGAAEINLAVTFANQAAMALDNATLFSQTDEELQKQVRSLSALNRVMLSTSQSLVLDDVSNNALQAVIEVIGASAAWIYLLGEGESRLRLRGQQGFSADSVGLAEELEVGEGPNGWVARTGQTLLVEDIRQDSRLNVHAAMEESLHSLAAVPLRAKDTVVGVLGAATRHDRSFLPTEVDLLSAIGSQVGIAVENARLYQRSSQVAILEERNRLAREIHDALAQGLTGIIVQLEAMERLAQRRPDQALGSLHRAKDLARRSLQEARRSVWGLRPRSLEEMTLTEALRARVETLRANGQLHTSFGVSGSRRLLSPDVELNLFRIAQEALNNIQRHAHAETIHVQLDYGQAHVRLVVEDDGLGLPSVVDPPADGPEEERQSFGLIGMRERAALLGGQMTISSERGQGTRIEVIVPG